MDEEPKKTGRPLRNFDKKTFEGLCEIQCTVQEIESIFWTDQRTIDKWCQREYNESFSTLYKRFSDDGKMSLRRLQLYHAKKSPAMAIFLGKVILGQRDTVPIDESITTNQVQIDAMKKMLNHLEAKQVEKQAQSALKIAESNVSKE